jgi:hypothetical protein
MATSFRRYLETFITLLQVWNKRENETELAVAYIAYLIDSVKKEIAHARLFSLLLLKLSTFLFTFVEHLDTSASTTVHSGSREAAKHLYY